MKNSSTMARVLVLSFLITVILGGSVIAFNHNIEKADAANLSSMDTDRNENLPDKMYEAANQFLESLDKNQKEKALLDFEDDWRVKWHFTWPKIERSGLRLKDMNESQRKLAEEFLKIGLSKKGQLKVQDVRDLEIVLRDLGGGDVRDPEKYYFTIFGPPSKEKPWGWKMEGHHVSLNYTIIDGTLLSVAPRFLGSNPGEVREGKRKGFRALAAEEDLARELVESFDEAQKAKAVFEASAYGEIVTMVAAKVDPLEPVGVPAGGMNEVQASHLLALLNEYLSIIPEEIAKARMKTIRQSEFDEIYFGWAGSTKIGEAHYYRIQGPTFLIEYDNFQNDANHVHTVWRDFKGDFGRDLLKEHYEQHKH